MTTLGKTFAVALRQPSRFLTFALLFSGIVLGITYRHWTNAATGKANTKTPATQSVSSATELRAALTAARYQISKVKGDNGEQAFTAINPAQTMRMSFSGRDVQVESSSACQTPWQLRLQLKRIEDGAQAQAVLPGQITAQENRIEIHHPAPTSQREIQITEWYYNKPEGLEQGFTLHSATPAEGDLRVVMELSNGWKATTEPDQQAIQLQKGEAALRYDKLQTVDATGRILPSKMELNGNELALVVNDTDAVWPITIDPTLTQQTQFTAPNGAAFDHFGAAVAISGDTAVIGVPDFDVSGNTNAGTAFVFVRNGAAWSQQAQLSAADAGSYDSFGSSIAIHGDTIVVGAYGDDNGFNADQGAAYVFVRNGAAWSQQAKLAATSGAANDWFGYAVAVHANTVIVGAPLDDFSSTVNQGSAYVFTRNGSSWVQQQQLNATDASDSDNFGFAVAISTDTAVVGAPADDLNGGSDLGSAYVFTQSNATWSQQQQLSASDGASGDLLGYAVAISGETVTIGAPQDDVSGNVNQGSAYVFIRNASTWSQQTKLTASDGASGDTFGNSIALSNEMAVIGAPTNDVGGSIDQGSAYVFVRSGTTWSQQQQTIAADGAGGDSLGSSVAISGFTSIVGAANDDLNGNTDQGSAYAFSPTCPTMTLSPATLTGGTQNLTYPTTAISSSAGTAPLTYAVIAGALPAGLTFSASGELAGAPTVAGNFNFTVKVTDANLCTGTRAYSLAIASCAPPMVTTQPANQSTQVGSNASFTVTASGTPPTVQWQVSTDGNTWNNVSNATATTLNLSNLAITMNGNRYRAIFTNACGTATTSAATLTVNKLAPTVALSLSGNTSTYGRNVTLTATINSINAVSVSGTVTFKSAATTLGTATITNGQAALSLTNLPAAAHSITAEYSGDSNYSNATSTASSLTVSKASLTVTAESKTKTYGAANPTFTATITGFVNNESLSVVSGAAELSSSATNSSAAGEYTITATRGTLSASNYDFIFAPAKLTINKASLTVTAENKSRLYGTANPEFTATIAGFVNGDNANAVTGAASFSTTATASSSVGSYPITVEVGSLVATNYDFTFAPGVLSITAQTLTVTAQDKQRIYGAANPTLTFQVTGFVNGDAENVLSGTPDLSTTASAASSIGVYPIQIAQGTLSASNYALTFVNGTLTVEKTTLTVVTNNASRSYGADNPELSGTITGIQNNDRITVSYSTTAMTTSGVNTYTITPALNDPDQKSGNYQITTTNGTLTITPAALTITTDNKTRTYGADNPELSGTITGIQNNDRITVSYTTTATTASGVNTYAITPALNDPDQKSENYQITTTNGTLTITPAALTITAENKTRTYGAANPTLTASLSGFVNGENESALTGALQISTAANESSAVGNYPITVSGYTATNYAINFINGTLNITKASLTVTAENKSKVYGAANPELTTSITGFVNNEGVSVLSGAAELTTTATQNSAAGSYPITVAKGTLASENYEVTFVNGTLTIRKARLTVAAANKTKVFGAQVPELTYDISGFVNGDTLNVVSGAPTLNTTATATSNVGVYPISATVGSLAAESYDFNFVSAELMISPASTALVLVSNVPSSLFGQPVTFTANLTAVAPGAGTPTGAITFKNGANVIGAATLVNGQASLTTSALATGSHSITAEYKGTENFVSSISATLTQNVSKAAATVALASSFESVRYGQTVSLSATISGGSDTPTGNVRFLIGNTTLGTVALTNGTASLSLNTLPVATHTITAIYDGDAKNEGGSSRTITLTVNKASQPVQLGTSVNPAAWKQFVTLSASVNSAGNGLVAPSGTIVFKQGTNVLGTSALSRLGRASISTNALSPGEQAITAEFSGDNNYETSAATPRLQTISKGATAIRLTSSTAKSSLGQNVFFTAQIHSNAGIPTGNIELYNGDQLIGTESLNSGFVTWSISGLGDGDHQVKAVYKGDEQFATSTSAPVMLTVSALCTWTLESKGAVFGLDGGLGYVRVNGRSDCLWTAFTNSPWITILDYGPEVGAVSFSVAALTNGTSRKGIINIEGQQLTVIQAKSAVTVSGASYTREGIAPDAIASVFGEAMASATELAQTLPLPTTLAGTQVKVTDSKGIERLAPLFYVSPLQINYLIPSDVAYGTALVTIQTQSGEITGGGMIEVAPVTPGLFTATSNGSGVAAADVQRVLVDNSQRYEPVYRYDPAQNKVVSAPIDFGEEGEEVYLVLFGTGLRSRIELLTVRATIDNEDIEVLYAGSQGGFVGLDQINLKLPRKLAGKGEVELKLYVEGKLANTVRINLK